MTTTYGPLEPSPMNEAEACKRGSSPPYPGVYSDGKGHSISVTYAVDAGAKEAHPVISWVPTSPLTQCAYLHADNDPDFRCSFRPVEGSQYCSFHRAAVAGDITRAKAKAYDVIRTIRKNFLEGRGNGYIDDKFSLPLRNQPDIKKDKE